MNFEEAALKYDFEYRFLLHTLYFNFSIFDLLPCKNLEAEIGSFFPKERIDSLADNLGIELSEKTKIIHLLSRLFDFFSMEREKDPEEYFARISYYKKLPPIESYFYEA
jgi:hypothetical protein